MARLIDADKLLTNVVAVSNSKGQVTWSAVPVMNIITAPTVDAVEVVRCRECKHRYNGKDCTHPLLLSYSFGAIRNVKDNDFCSYGERKEGAN